MLYVMVLCTPTTFLLYSWGSLLGVHSPFPSKAGKPEVTGPVPTSELCEPAAAALGSRGPGPRGFGRVMALNASYWVCLNTVGRILGFTGMYMCIDVYTYIYMYIHTRFNVMLR